MTYRGNILPSLPPLADDHIVTVCASCENRCCLFHGGKCRCAARKADQSLGTIERTVGQLRARPKPEHHSYWRHEEGDNPDMPKSIEELVEFAAHQRKQHTEKPTEGWTLEERASLFAGYITVAELGLDQAFARDAIRNAYPEAAEAIDKWLKEAS